MRWFRLLVLAVVVTSIDAGPVPGAKATDTAPGQSATPQVTIRVDARQAGRPVSLYLTGACIEDVNHEIYGGIYSQMLFGESFQEPPIRNSDSAVAVSGMWRPIRTSSATLHARLDSTQPFVGAHSQFIEHAGGEGEVGIENQGLNRRGLSLRRGKVYEGYLWARAEKPTKLFVSLENRDGTKRYAETQIEVTAGDWRRYDFSLTPDADDASARFAIRLKSPGAVTLGHAFLQPGPWGRFGDFPVRRDVVEGLIDQGVSVLRYGGSMVNAPEYRWKKMIGPRDRRPPYRGTWYPFSTNGWGIIDFLDLCDAAGFLGIPAFNIDQSPQDMADFVEYVNGPATSTWGGRRAADGRTRPYNLKYLELGNEERVDEAYARKFAALSQAIWSKDPNVIPVVGDFAYGHPIVDPMKFDGAASRITSLAAHRTILNIAKSGNHEVWFDVHIGTSGPGASNDLNALPSYVEALDKVAEGAKHRVVVFEFNANHHDQRRALGNALAIGRIERDGRIPIATSANALQPDEQNDNGWNQGLLFLNPSQVWLQPPGYVTQMIARSRLALSVLTTVTGNSSLDVTAETNKERKSLVLRVVNPTDAAIVGELTLDGLVPAGPSASIVTLAAPLNTENAAEHPNAFVPTTAELPIKSGTATTYSFPARSFTVLLFK